MTDIAIIASVIPARFPLLKRSMVTWAKSIRASGLAAQICLYVEDESLAEAMHFIPPDVTFRIQRGDRSGSHCAGYNWWHEHMGARVYLFTHPDIMFPKDTIATAFANATDDTYVAFKVFWMGQQMTEHIESFNWRCPETLEHETMLYDDDPRTHGEFYYNENVRKITCWESSTTYAINRQTASRMYPLHDFKHQGGDDPFQAGLRQRLGIRNHTVMEPVLLHQWHPNSWFGTAEDAVREAQEALNKRFQ